MLSECLCKQAWMPACLHAVMHQQEPQALLVCRLHACMSRCLLALAASGLFRGQHVLAVSSCLPHWPLCHVSQRLCLPAAMLQQPVQPFTHAKHIRSPQFGRAYAASAGLSLNVTTSQLHLVGGRLLVKGTHKGAEGMGAANSQLSMGLINTDFSLPPPPDCCSACSCLLIQAPTRPCPAAPCTLFATAGHTT